ncbi:restriction endonuclease [Peribacillus sp. SCS-37]|uniref:restriction endonuclease n=1 Tax=Paraperibacillus esterisolvens TaxID=3115296 RepID=UPI0039060596
MDNRLHLLFWLAMVLVPSYIAAVTKSFEPPFLTFMSGLLLYSIYGLIFLHRMMKRQEKSEIWVIHNMTDAELEDFTAALLGRLGYTILVPQEGYELLSFTAVDPSGRKAAVKVKSHKRSVGIRLVQKTLRQLPLYEASDCWVITNNGFTPQAQDFAKANNIHLYDREQYITWILKAKKDEKAGPQK